MYMRDKGTCSKKLQDQKAGRGTRGVNEMGKKTCENGAAV